MSGISKKTDHNNTANLVNEINTLLGELRKAKESGNKIQKGGFKNLVSEVNHLLSEINGVDSNLDEDQVTDLAMKGGAKKKKSKGKSKSKSKSKPKKSKKSKSKSKSKSQSRPKKSKSKSKSKSKPKTKKSKGKSKSKSQSRPKKSKSKSKSKSKNRKMKREAGEGSTDKKKRAPNQYIVDLTALRAHIKSKLPNENLNNVGAMSKAAAKILSANDRDVDKAKKNFKATSFMRDYNTAKKEIEAKKAAKKANKV
jgi:hypothetical protein